MKKKVILCPNPYRDSELKVAKDAKAILEGIGFETVVCLPFHRDGYGDELGVPVRQLQQEIKSADLMIAFGGDGTILHLSRTAALHNVPVLGINLGSLGFMSELEANELERLRDLQSWDFVVESRMMLDVTIFRNGNAVYSNIALNDAVVSKGSVARVVRLDIFTEEGRLTKVTGDGVVISTPTRLHRLFHGGGRPHRGAYSPESADHAHLSPLHPRHVLCAVAGACDHHRGGGRQPEVRLSLRRRRQGVFSEKRR